MEEKKILYVFNAPLQQSAGADRVNIRNNQLLNQTTHIIINYEITQAKPNKLKTVINFLRGYCCGIRKEVITDIIDIINRESIEIVFLSSSKLGVLSKLLSRIFHNIKIVVFFHNIEKQYGDELLKTSNSLQNKFINKIIDINEQNAITYGDVFITMNQRDSQLLDQYYNRRPDLILPLGFTDIYCKNCPASKYDDFNNKLKLLFVGSAFFANINGMSWFIKQVYPRLNNVEITIVGKNMCQYFCSSKSIHNNSSIRVEGYVEDLMDVYDNSHVVISPIFEGGGMKTKTAEAMMYGCPIIGTQEAFQGYNIDYNRIGAICNTSDEFVNAINLIRISKENLINKSQYSRSIFLNNYETNVLLRKMQTLLDTM